MMLKKNYFLVGVLFWSCLVFNTRHYFCRLSVFFPSPEHEDKLEVTLFQSYFLYHDLSMHFFHSMNEILNTLMLYSFENGVLNWWASTLFFVFTSNLINEKSSLASIGTLVCVSLVHGVKSSAFLKQFFSGWPCQKISYFWVFILRLANVRNFSASIPLNQF